MYDELVKALRNNADHYGFVGENGLVHLLTNAADAIEELLPFKKQVEKGMGLLDKANELLKAVKPRWIPVTEALPEEMDQSCGGWSAEIRPSDDVLVWLSPEKRQSVAWYSHAYNEWTTVDENTVYCFGEVTHWMQLPQPPKSITKADRIRAMTDEELAIILAYPSVAEPPWCACYNECPHISEDPTPCDKCALDWLKQEVSE